MLVLHAVAALSWVTYAATLATSSPNASADTTNSWWCMPGMASSAGWGSTPLMIGGGVGAWTLMAAAMTLPAAMPAAQHIATNSLTRYRWQAVAIFAAIYLGAWAAFGLLAMSASTVLATGARGTALIGVFAIAAAYELSPLKRHALNRCHRSTPLRPTGLAAVVSAVRFGWTNSSGCVGACWVAMLSMALVPAGAQLLAALALTVITTQQKLTRRPRRARRRAAVLYAVAASGIAILGAAA